MKFLNFRSKKTKTHEIPTFNGFTVEEEFSEDGYALAKNNAGKYNYVTKNGEKLFNNWYYYLSRDPKTKCTIAMGLNPDGVIDCNLVDPEGCLVFEPFPEDVRYLGHGFYLALTKDGKSLLYDFYRNTILGYEFKEVEIEDGLYLDANTGRLCYESFFIQQGDSVKLSVIRLQREDGLFNILKPDGTLFSKEWLKNPICIKYYCVTENEQYIIYEYADGTYGYADTNGELFTHERFKEIKPFTMDVTAVQQLDGKWKFIKQNGEDVSEERYASIRVIHY